MTISQDERRVLIANRGEVACRVIRACHAAQFKAIALYANADRSSLHVMEADEAWSLEGDHPKETYLNPEKVLEVAKKASADLIHPGYGFLSENPEFAEMCEAEGISWVGPSPKTIRLFALKHKAREMAKSLGVAVLEGSPLIENEQQLLNAALKIGFPIMMKATAGGGGMGIVCCRNEDELLTAYDKNRTVAGKLFSDDRVYLEHYVENPRHIEIQIFGDGHGKVSVIGPERECSIQRRHQKVIEESPSPSVGLELRHQLQSWAIALGESVSYRSAGTVEFLLDSDTNDAYFLEMNTRLQVEHGITELVSGVDIVASMLNLAWNSQDFKLKLSGPKFTHAIECRVCAEDPALDFAPSCGTIEQVSFPSFEWLRIDSGIHATSSVSPHYDSLLVKLMSSGHSREESFNHMLQVLNQVVISGITTNIPLLEHIIASSQFQAGKYTTKFLVPSIYDNRLDIQLPPHYQWMQHGIQLIHAGFSTTIQSWPGRTGYWHVGIPPSGPMDPLAHRSANMFVGNESSAACLEFTLKGPTLRFTSDFVFALTGACTDAVLITHESRKAISYWKPYHASAGDILLVNQIQGAGMRGYLAISGGFDVASYMGSTATFPLGQLGGYFGRQLRDGDYLRVNPGTFPELFAPSKNFPQYTNTWRIGVIPGAHDTSEFFTVADVRMFYDTKWQVHFNSNRMGIRLNGPKPTFARKDGGEGGSHPSNVHDCTYAIGSINFTGDMPIVLMNDGPSLGGFVCMATVAGSEMWKLGQVAAEDNVQFYPVTYADACHALTQPLLPAPQLPESEIENSCVRYKDVAYRQAGERCLLVEYGEMVLDLRMRFRIHALMQSLRPHMKLTAVQRKGGSGGFLEELCPGVRSVQIQYDPLGISKPDLLQLLWQCEDSLPDVSSGEFQIESRLVKLPIAVDDEWSRMAIDKYMRSVRSKATYLPDNIQFIAENNGVPDRMQVLERVMKSEYLVLGLGDVYLGAPCAVPLNALSQFTVPKYNPARTFTPEGAVGIGGSYLCIYPMESPGGYQLIGRTLPIWDKHCHRSAFGNKPWLLRWFDRIQFYPVTSQELLSYRHDLASNKQTIDITPGKFHLSDYLNQFIQDKDAIDAFKLCKQTSSQCMLQKEMEMVKCASDITTKCMSQDEDDESPPPGGTKVVAPCAGSVWKIVSHPGTKISDQAVLVVLESMKMEFEVRSGTGGTWQSISSLKEGQFVHAGQMLGFVLPS